MRKTFILLFTLIAFCFNASAQYGQETPLPLNPDLKVGKLPNGLTYYILHNEEPEQRADFYIIYSVGALQENEDQNGLAHFLEHMAFNGTRNFPGGNSEPTSIVKTLERHAMAFGRNINAYTSFDRTVYHLDNAPVTDEALVDTCLLVLHDWAHYVSLEGDEIDNERGVISEEWRQRNNAQARVRNKWFPVIFGDTKYSTHDVIGDYDVINNFTYDNLRQFYYDWYRTDQQAIAIVGDIDIAKMEQKIKEVFSSIPAVENPKQKEVIVLPENSEPDYVLATDKEQTNNMIQVMMIQPEPKMKSAGDLKKNLIDGLYNDMLGLRISEKTMKEEPVMLIGGASKGGLIDGYGAYTITVSPKTGLDCKGIEFVYTEVVRAQRFGFLQTELDRSKQKMLTRLENEYKQKDKITNSQLITSIVSLFVYNDIMMSADDNYALRKSLINEITLDDVNAAAAGYPQFKNVKLILTGDEEWKAPSKEEILAVFAKVDADKSIKPYEEESVIAGLIDNDVVPGRIVKEKNLPIFGAKEWTLSNGAKVVYANASYDKDLINLAANSYGGKSLYPDEAVKTVELTGMFGGSLGLGNCTIDQMDKYLQGKKAKTSISIDSYSEGIKGESNVKDFETMMQMAYLRFVNPKFDEKTFNNLRDRFAMLQDMLTKGPASQMTDSLVAIVSNYNKRAESVKSDDIRNLQITDVEKYYRERFSDPSDFTFFIVGDIDEQSARSNAEKYIASIPAKGVKEKWVNDHIETPDGRTTKNVHIPFQTPKASVYIIYNKDIKMTPKNKLCYSVLCNILRARYIATIREKEGGTYGVSVKGSMDKIPSQNGTMIVSFDTEPSKAQHLKEIAMAEIDSVLKDGVTQEEITNVVKNLLKERAQIKSKNEFVATTLKTYVLEGVDNSDPKNYEDILNNMKPSDIQKFAKKFFKKADILDIIFTTDENNL